MNDLLNTIPNLMNRPEHWDFSDAEDLCAGVDIGTYETKIVIVDERGRPRAAAGRRADVVKSGLILDYFGALNLVRNILGDIRDRSPLPIEKGATSYPPRTESANQNTTRYLLEGAELEVVNVLDEPSAANLVINRDNGAIVDVGGGTTGMAVVHSGKVVYSNDEPTGGLHMTLVLSGSLGVPHDEAERIKQQKSKTRELLPVLRPVIDKISTIVGGFLDESGDVDCICLVGGAVELDGMAEIVGQNLKIETFRPSVPQWATPYGIALSCLTGANGGG